MVGPGAGFVEVPVRLGQVLEERGYMTADEITMVLQIQKMVTSQA